MLLHLQNKWLLKSLYCKLHLTIGLHIRGMQHQAARAVQLCMTHKLSELSPFEKGLRMRARKPQKKILRQFLLTIVNNVDTYHRIIVTLRLEGIWGSSSSIPLPRQDHLHQVTQKSVQVGFECSQTGRFHNPPGQSLFQCSATLNVRQFFS